MASVALAREGVRVALWLVGFVSVVVVEVGRAMRGRPWMGAAALLMRIVGVPS